MFTLTSIS